MRRLAFVFVPALLAFALSGCESCDKKPAPEPAADAGTSAAPPPADAAAEPTTATDAGAKDAKKALEMANCPTAVGGATVALADVEGGIALSITGKDDAATAEIRERTKKLVEAERTAPEAGVRHTGRGEGGGVYGRCTIVMRNTSLETSEIPGGTKIVVKAKDKAETDWLRRETRDRDKEAKVPGAEAAGSQRMANCPSAVPGAKTDVKNVEGGVVVTVTGDGDKAAEIRTRAKHVLEVGKKGGAEKVEHTGGGTGGGGLGRCPVVVDGDTTLEVKEVEGGAEITVKTAKDVPALQKEAKERAANFSVR